MCAFRAEDGHVLLGPETKDAEVIRPVDVVGVEVGEPHGLDEAHSLPHQLEPQLRGKVYQEAAPVQMEEGPVTSPPVSGVMGGARGAPAADNGDPEGGAGPEESELHT